MKGKRAEEAKIAPVGGRLLDRTIATGGGPAGAAELNGKGEGEPRIGKRG